MADRFLDFPIALTTPHFLITYASDADVDAQARAQAIGATCENDLKALEGWFACSYDNSPHGIWVHVAPGTHLGGASNFGYESDQSSRVIVRGTYAPPVGASNATFRDEIARMVFVAELAEVLMDFSGSAWDRHDSMGEGLSILAAETLHPTGYYATGSGPRINQWLQARPDFVAASEQTDTNQVSYGCAVLFLNYLRYQLGFSFTQIVAAAGDFQLLAIPGVTKIALADVLSTLTGRPRESAFQEFTDLLQAHIPFGTAFTAAGDNLFPLRDAKQRAVSITGSEDELNAVPDPETLFIKRQAGPLCPPNVYTYHNVDVSSRLTVSGRAAGFAQPTFTWSLNGAVLNNSTVPQFTTVSMKATDTVPGLGEPAVVVSLAVKYLIVSSGLSSTLTIFNQDFPGNGALTVSLSAAESLVTGDGPANDSDSYTILTRRYSMNGAWARDVTACNIKDLGVITATVKSLAHRMVEDENRPNPNPATVRALAHATQRYVEALNEVTNGSRGLDLAVATIFTGLEAVHAPLQALTYSDSRTGLRILRKVPGVSEQVAEHTADGVSIEVEQTTS